MPTPLDPPADSRSARLRGALRWLVALAVGGATTLGLFALMAGVVDATWIVQRMFRIFPLTQTPFASDEDCSERALWRAVAIEGVVGTLRGGALRPLPGMRAEGHDPVSGTVAVDVAADGSFRFAAAFADEAPSACAGAATRTSGPPPRLVFRAPHCKERVVPVTAAWVPHAIVLDCSPEG